MQRHAILACATLLLTFASSSLALAVNVTPKSSKALVVEPFAYQIEDVGQPITDLRNAGYSVTTLKESSLSSSPGVTVSAIESSFGDGNGVLIYVSHGSTTGIIGEVMPYSSDNLSTIRFRIQQYEAFGIRNLQATWDTDRTFCGIYMESQFVRDQFSSKRSIVFNHSCYGASYSGSWGAHAVLAYSGLCPSSTLSSDLTPTFAHLRGDFGNSFRPLGQAVTSRGYATLHGNGNIVLVPVVEDYSPESYTIGSDQSGWVTFNAKMDKGNAKSVVVGTGTIAVTDQSWSDDYTLSFTIKPVCTGDGTVKVLASKAKGEGGGDRYLDGDGDGTYNDDWYVEYESTASNACDNQAVSLSGVWAVRDPDATRVEWIADVQRNTSSYTIVGQPGDVPLTTVPATPGPGPHAYSVTVPDGFSGYGLRETETSGKVNTYRSVPLTSAPAERSAALAIGDLILPTGVRAIAPQPESSVPIDDGGGGGGSPVVQIAVIGPDSLLTQMQPAVDLWRNTDGLRVQEFRTLSPDPAPIQAFLASIKQQADAAGEAYPLVLLVGDANEGGEPAKNILSMFYSPDPTGGAFFTDEYPTDDPYADFNSDGISDFNLMRIPADRPVEVTNAVQTYLACRAQGTPNKSLLLLTGDVDEGGNPADGVVLGAHEVRNRYEMAGFQVDQLLDSSFPFNDLGPRQQAFAAQISAGVAEVWGRAPLTNRSIWPGYFAQKANQPPWNWDWVTSGGAPFIFWAPGCDLADVDRNNPVFDPTLAESFLFIGTGKRSAVAVVSCGRGAYGVVHDLFEQTLLEARFSGYHATALDVFWEAKRTFAGRYPGLLGYVQAMTYLGWPAPLSGASQTGVAETSPVPQARLEVSPNPFRVSTVIRFALAERSPVKVEVYDISGRLVTQLVNDVRPPGEYVVPWTGQRQDGTMVAQGVYFVRAITAGLQRTAPITIIR